jgi:hypothetical protein
MILELYEKRGPIAHASVKRLLREQGVLDTFVSDGRANSLVRRRTVPT